MNNGETGEGGNSTGGGNSSSANEPNIGNNNRTPLWRRSGCNDKWLRWLLFIISILVIMYLLSKCTQIGQKLACKYDEERYRAEWKKFKEKNDSLETKIDSLEMEDDGGHFVDADFLIVTYYFDSISGKDLDTRTRLINPVSSDTLGFGFKKVESSDLLRWAEDNTKDGAESCLIDLRKFSNEDIVQIDCSAFWWEERFSGNITMVIQAYKDGVIELVNYEFKNSGGYKKGDFIYPDNIKRTNKTGNKKDPGQYIGTITYNKEINYLSLDKY